MSRQKRNAGEKPARKQARHGRLAIFPAAAVDDSRVSASMLAVLAALSTYTSRSGYVEASHASIAVRLGVSRQYVQRILATLEALGYLKSARRKRASDQGETSKAYRLELDYTLPVVHWRYVPTDYGTEPEEDALGALFLFSPPAITEIAPPAISQVAPPAITEIAPPAPVEVAPRTIGINDIVIDGVEGARAREVGPADFAIRIAAAAGIPPGREPHNQTQTLASALERFRADGLSETDMEIAASDCRQWYAEKRGLAPRLGNLTDWLRREVTRRRKLEAGQEGISYADTTDAAGSSAGARHASAGRSGGSTRRARGDRSQARGGREAAPDAATPGERNAATLAEWRPGSRAYLEPERDGDSWYIITETGEREAWRDETSAASATAVDKPS